MKLLTSYIPAKYRSAARFVIVGTTGMFVQDGIYRACLDLDLQVFVAFAIGFVIEMVINYFVSAWYTYGAAPSLKNAGGFLLARALNLGVQFLFLHLLLLCGVAEEWAGFPSIFLAGIINYFVCLLFFKKPQGKHTKK